MSKETFYFSHDYNARNDIKIKRLIVKHGYEGYGIFWALIEDLYQNANAMPLDYDCIAYDFRVDSYMIESIINDFDLFEVNDDTFGSLSVQRRLNKRNEKSRKARESAMKRWGRDAKALNKKCEGNAIKESKVKESKVKDNTNTNTKRVFNFRKSLLDYGFEKELVDEWMVIRKTKKAVNSEFAYNTFISQIVRAGGEKNELLRIIAEKQWSGFNHDWMKTLNNNSNNNLNSIENETDRRARESAKRRQDLYEDAKRAGMVGGEKEQDTPEIW